MCVCVCVLTFSHIGKYKFPKVPDEFAEFPHQFVPWEISGWVISYQNRNEIWTSTLTSTRTEGVYVSTHYPYEIVINIAREISVLTGYII